jgi:eukaryotic-like serine/threonine-protein kinase
MDKPTRLGKYEILDMLGKGAMGVVYKGFDPHILRPVALKTIRSDRLGGDVENIFARFENEAKAAGRLSHPGIVSIYECGEEGSVAYIAMEYVEGHTLHEYFSQGMQFSLADTISILVQLLDAIGHAHEQGVVHRDIKPGNIILTQAGRLKVTDFGIAHIQSSELTQVGMIMGTPYYMAPEQYQGIRVDGRADLYSAGVLLFYLLTGKKPFDGSREQLAYSVCNVPAPRPSTVAPGRAPLRFDVVVETALAKKPEERYPTAHAFKEALMAAYPAPVAAAVSEETRIFDSGPGRAANELLTPKTDTGGSSLGSDNAPPTGWDLSLLKKVEQQLAVFVGPFARLMVKKAAKSTTDLESLYSRLAGELEGTEERRKFLRSHTQTGSGRTMTPVDKTPSRSGISGRSADVQEAMPSTDEAISPETIEEASRLLATFLGPIAKVLAKRAAPQCTTRQQLYSKLAENLSDKDERNRFLRMISSGI